MKIILTLTLFISFINIYGQDKIYLDKKYKKTNQKEQAQYYRIINPDAENHKIVIEQTYYVDGKIKYERKYSNYNKKKKVLEQNTVWFKNGNKHIVGNYSKGKMHGDFISYWENGQLKRKDFYKKGKLVEGNCWDNSGKEVPYYDFEIRPEFPGGKNALVLYLKENIDYNQVSSSSKGKRVHVRFYIAKDGSIIDVIVVKGIDKKTDQEAKRLIQDMPKWKPAIQDGSAVKVRRTLPIVF